MLSWVACAFQVKQNQYLIEIQWIRKISDKSLSDRHDIKGFVKHHLSWKVENFIFTKASRGLTITYWPKRSKLQEAILAHHPEQANQRLFIPWCGIYSNTNLFPWPDILISRSISRLWSCRILFTWSLCVVSSSCCKLLIFVKFSISSSSLSCFMSLWRLRSSLSFTATSWFSYWRLRFSSTLLSF